MEVLQGELENAAHAAKKSKVSAHLLGPKCTFSANLYSLVLLNGYVLHLQTKNTGQVPSQTTTPASSVFDEELKSKIEENAMLHKKVMGLQQALITMKNYPCLSSL